jgi:hypothetical protein
MEREGLYASKQKRWENGNQAGMTPVERFKLAALIKSTMPDEVVKLVVCLCPCGVSFDPWLTEAGEKRRFPRRYAADACRWRAQRAEDPKQLRKCPCGIWFDPDISDTGKRSSNRPTAPRRYHSNECRQQGKSQSQRESHARRRASA